MKLIVALFAVVIGVSLIGQSDAFWGWGRGWGGYGFGLGYGYGYGYPYYGGYGWGYPYSYWGYGKRDVSQQALEQVANRTECVFSPKASTLECNSPKSVVVDCPVVFVEPQLSSFPRYFRFGIERLNSSRVYSDDLFYRLFPRKLDDSAYVNDQWLEQGKEFRYALYYAAKNSWWGLRVTDKVCFERLFDLFRESVRNEEVFLESDLKEKPRVNLFGELLLQF